MRDTTFRKTGLSACMILTLLATSVPGVSPALAQSNCSVENGVQTCVDPTTGIVDTTWVGTGASPVTAEGISNNPMSLFASSGDLGTNVTGLLQNGMSTEQLSQILGSAGGANGINAEQWSGILENIQSGNLDLATGANLVNGVFGGYLDPQLGEALSQIGNLGNITSVQGITNLLNNNAIQNVLQGMNPAQAGAALDQILQSALGSNFNLQALQNLATQANIDALVNAIGQAIPGLADLLGAGGLQEALSGALNQIAGTAIGQALGGALGGGLNAGLTGGFGGAASGASGLGSSMGTCACSTCTVQIPNHHNRIRQDVTNQFERHRRWLITQYFMEHILPALMLMAEQLTVAGIYQVQIFGTFLDAKHQLETQRLFQQLTARAHKDYHPSEGMCTFGTTVRSLAMSDRKSDFAQTAVATRMMQRQTLNGEAISWQGTDSDMRSRLATFIGTYCDQADNQNGLTRLCRNAVPTPARRNIDVDFTRNVENRLTLNLALSDVDGEDATATFTPDEQDVYALGANLFSHSVVPVIEREKFGGLLQSGDYGVRVSAAERYLDLRAIFAKRSVAQNSYAALVGMRAQGDPESAPYVKAVLRELGVSSDDEINALLGDQPSYFAQMEVLTKKLYQNPVFYTELYDKPVNIERKGAALQAIGLMQDRDLFNSLLRSEAVLSVLLEVLLEREQEKVTNQKGRISAAGGQ